MADTLVGAIVEIYIIWFPVGWQGAGVDSETVVLRTYHRRVACYLLDRLVATAMSVFQLEGVSAGC